MSPKSCDAFRVAFGSRRRSSGSSLGAVESRRATVNGQFGHVVFAPRRPNLADRLVSRRRAADAFLNRTSRLLHADPALLPATSTRFDSWNYLSEDPSARPVVTLHESCSTSGRATLVNIAQRRTSLIRPACWPVL
jgi:hypothetical protein